VARGRRKRRPRGRAAHEALRRACEARLRKEIARTRKRPARKIPVRLSPTAACPLAEPSPRGRPKAPLNEPPPYVRSLLREPLRQAQQGKSVEIRSLVPSFLKLAREFETTLAEQDAAPYVAAHYLRHREIAGGGRWTWGTVAQLAGIDSGYGKDTDARHAQNAFERVSRCLDFPGFPEGPRVMGQLRKAANRHLSNRQERAVFLLRRGLDWDGEFARNKATGDPFGIELSRTTVARVLKISPNQVYRVEMAALAGLRRAIESGKWRPGRCLRGYILAVAPRGVD